MLWYSYSYCAIFKKVFANHQLPRGEIKEILEQQGSEEVARLERRLGILAALGQVAPLIGLLGSVMGFMETKEVVTDHHKHFSGAMIPLALGLAIGIPCFVGYNHLVAVIGALVVDMQKAGLRALRMISEMDRLARKIHSKPEAAKSTDPKKQS